MQVPLSDFDQDLEEIPCEFQQQPSHLAKIHKHQHVKFTSNFDATHLHNVTPKKKAPQQFMNKTANYILQKKQKIDNLKNQFQHRAMADCTFKPQINRSKSKNARNLKQFLDSQQKHQNKVDQKKAWMKQRIEEENKKDMTFSPKINTKKMIKNKENVHERLYKLKDKDRELSPIVYNHIPKITARGERIVRNLPIDEILYQDARRRAQKQYQPPEIQEHVVSKNINKERYAAHKFLKDYINALKKLSLNEKNIYDEEDFLLILRQLGYANYHNEVNNTLVQEERKLIKEAYSYLVQYTVTKFNLYVFLLALAGIFNVDINDNEISEVLVIGDEEGRQLHQYFDRLFRNRLFNDYSKKLSKTPTKEENNFTPIINSNTQFLAEKYRCKMIGKANDIFSKNDISIQIPEKGISHNDFLAIYNMGQILQKQKLRELKLNEKDPECTFQPNYQKHGNDYFNQTTGNDKCQQLYEQARFKQTEENKLNMTGLFSNLEVQSTSQRQIKLPITPKKQFVPLPKSSKKSYLDIKDVDKTLARMVMGRQLRDEKKVVEERGQRQSKKQQYPRSSKGSVSRTSKQQKQVLFDVDVNIGGTIKKILVCEQDQFRISELVSEFARQNHLDEHSQLVLEQKLQQAMNSMLKYGDEQDDYE